MISGVWRQKKGLVRGQDEDGIRTRRRRVGEGIERESGRGKQRGERPQKYIRKILVCTIHLIF